MKGQHLGSDLYSGVKQKIKPSKSLISELGFEDNEQTLKRQAGDSLGIQDCETIMMGEMDARRRALDQNEWLHRKLRNLQEDYFYFQNKYEHVLAGKDKEQERARADPELNRRLQEEKERLSNLLMKTVEENERLQAKLDGLNLTQMMAPVLNSKILGVDPEEQVTIVNEQMRELQNKLIEEKARNQEIVAEREYYKTLLDREKLDKENLRLEERKEKHKQRSEIDKLVHEAVVQKLQFQQNQSARREKDSTDDRKNLLDRIDAMKTLNEQFNQDKLSLKKTMEEKDKTIASLEASMMKLQNEMAEVNSKLDLAQSEKEVNLTGKQNANRQIELMKRQIEELKSALDACGKRAAEHKHTIDILEREKEYAAEKASDLQFEIHNLTVSNGALNRQIIEDKAKFEGLKNEHKILADELDNLKNGREDARQVELSILEKTIPVLQKENEDLMNQLQSKEALAEGSKKLARILMDENYDLKNQIEALLRPDMAVPSAQEQSKKALADLRKSYEDMFAKLIGKVTEIKKEGEKLPIIEKENLNLHQSLTTTNSELARIKQNFEEDKSVAENNLVTCQDAKRPY